MHYTDSMVFQKTSSIDEVAEYLQSVLLGQLDEGKKVIWLVPGGSAIAVTEACLRLLAGQDLSNLIIGLTDERFGPVGHADSNWLQMQQAGIDFGNGQLLPALTGANQATTTADYAAKLQQVFASADYKLGLFGMGPDGHTAGILPGSPAVSSNQWAASYDAGNFVRLTMTPLAIAALNEAVLYAMGESKLEALQNLQTDLPPSQQPAQALKTAKKLTIFNDQIGEQK